jgi:hypothetical protein
MSNFIQKTQGLACRIELHTATAGDDHEPEARLKRLLRRADIGAVIAIGSPVVNPFTDALARKVFTPDDADEDQPEEPPARFVWPRAAAARLAGSFLSEPASGEKVGLRRRDGVLHVRARDRAIVNAIKDGAWRGKVFPDCGMLVMDYRHDKYLLAFCAGHGGAGTLAASYGLTHPQFSQHLRESEQAPEEARNRKWYIGPKRACQIVDVTRLKPSSAPADDLEFDPHFQEGWHFILD